MTPLQSYTHTGTIPIGGALATIVAGGLVATIGGVVYAYAFHWIPIPYLNFLIALGFAGLIGGTVATVAKAGKIRSNGFVVGVAILMTLLGLYVYWGSYLLAMAGWGDVGLKAYKPAVIYRFAGFLFEKGSWGLGKGGAITGWFLVLFWVAETGMILVVSLMASMAHANVPFCESCQQWTEESKAVAKLAADGNEPTWQQVLGGDLPALADFSPAEGLAPVFVQLDLARCPRCEVSRFLTINKVQTTIDKNGEPSLKMEPLITNAMITPEQYAVVETCGMLSRELLADAAKNDDEPEQDPGNESPLAWETPPAHGEK
jgi:hypothetical protein